MSNDEHSGDSGTGGDGGDGEFARPEEPTKVERAVERTPSELELARADGAAFDAVASGLDAFAASIDALPEACQRLSRPRRSRFLWAVILKLGEVIDEAQQTRHDLTELKRIEDSGTNGTNGTTGEQP